MVFHIKFEKVLELKIKIDSINEIKDANIKGILGFR